MKPVVVLVRSTAIYGVGIPIISGSMDFYVRFTSAIMLFDQRIWSSPVVGSCAIYGAWLQHDPGWLAHLCLFAYARNGGATTLSSLFPKGFFEPEAHDQLSQALKASSQTSLTKYYERDQDRAIFDEGALCRGISGSIGFDIRSRAP